MNTRVKSPVHEKLLYEKTPCGSVKIMCCCWSNETCRRDNCQQPMPLGEEYIFTDDLTARSSSVLSLHPRLHFETFLVFVVYFCTFSFYWLPFFSVTNSHDWLKHRSVLFRWCIIERNIYQFNGQANVCASSNSYASFIPLNSPLAPEL